MSAKNMHSAIFLFYPRSGLSWQSLTCIADNNEPVLQPNINYLFSNCVDNSIG